MKTISSKRVLAATALLALPATVAAQIAPSTGTLQLPEDAGSYPTGTILIQDIDTVWTAAGDPIAGASILIEDGIIREIGRNLDAPGDARIIDGSGTHAMPGIVDEHSHIAMEATNEFTAPLVPEVRVIDALSAEDMGIYRALSGGVTTARIMHGSSNPIGGQSAVIKTRWGMDASRDLLIPGAPRFVKFALGENVTRKSSSGSMDDRRFPASRPGVEAIYDQAFTAAAEYRAEWERYRENPDEFRIPPRRDLRLEAIVDIMEGDIRVHAHSYRADEILMLMRIAERHGFTIETFTHVLEGYRVADEMAEHGAAGSTFSDWWQYKLEAYDAIPYNAALMHEAGVLTAINSDIPWLQSFMHLEIAKPVKYGNVSKLDALRMLTLNPATMLGVEDRVGSLEVGKEGDLVLMSGSPFSSYSRVEKTIVDGIVYYDLSAEPQTRDEPFRPITDHVITDGSMTQAPEPQRADAVRVARRAMGPNPGEPVAQEAVTALVGGTVHPVSGPAIENGVVVMEGGLIREVGAASSVQIPAGAREVDVSGRHVYPGMIDPLTTVGLFEFGQVGQATDQRETGQFNPHVRAIAAVNPYYPSLNVARANGITSVLTHQTSGLVTGTAAMIQFNDGDTFEQVEMEADAALTVNFPAPGEGPDGQEPDLEGGRIEELVDFFDRARTYAETPSVSDDPTAPFEANVRGSERVLLDAMVPVMRGERPVLFKGVDSEWQIRTLFAFLDRYPELDGVIVGADEAYLVADEIAERDLPVIITSAYSPTRDRDASITAAFRNAGILHSAGVQIAFATGSDGDVRNLPYHAAHSVAFGLPKDAGLAAVTMNAARILGLNTGSLEAGRRADLIVTDGDPLELLTRTERMWVGGREVDPMANKHTELYERFRGRDPGGT